MTWLRQRNLVAEQMDAPDVDPLELDAALRFIRRVNKLLRYNAGVVRAIEATMCDAPREQRLSVLDIATGSADLLIDLRRATGRPLDLIGLDLHARTIAHGAAAAASACVRFVRGDALALPFADASVDYVVSTMFLHHLPDQVAVAALREMRRVARRGLIVADLLRRRRAYAWITLFTLAASKMVRHDARASVAHAFTLEEARRLAAAAGLTDARFATTFGHRFVMTRMCAGNHQDSSS